MRTWVVAVVAGVVLAATAPVGSAAAVDAPPARRALIVGITDYSGRTHDAYGGAGDAIDVHDALRRAGWADGQIRVLTDRQATATGIRDGLKWLADSSTDDSFSIFHYSGHVKQLGGDRDHDGEALDEYLWPSDNRLISDGELGASLRRVRGRLWADVAGCEGAGLDDGVSGPNRLFTSSSRESEKSYEDPQWQNSVFTGLMVDLGMLHGQASAGDDKRLSIQEAFAYAASQAPGITSRQKTGAQHPVLSGGGTQPWFLDAAKPPPPPAKRTCPLLCTS